MQLPEGFCFATTADIPDLEKLVNTAYRGDSSRRGWTTEADLLDGIRTDAAALQEMIDKPNAVILLQKTEQGLMACVYLEKQNRDMYLGMLTVAPHAQARGTGKILLKLAEDYALFRQCNTVVMTVISQRTELIAWYQRRGYALTGEKRPFPTDPRFGIPKQQLEFVVLKKQLA